MAAGGSGGPEMVGSLGEERTSLLGGWSGVKGARWGGHLAQFARGSGCQVRSRGSPQVAWCGDLARQSPQSQSILDLKGAGGRVPCPQSARIPKHQPGMRVLLSFLLCRAGPWRSSASSRAGHAAR